LADYVVFKGGHLDGIWVDKSEWPSLSHAEADQLRAHNEHFIYRPTEAFEFREDGACAQVYCLDTTNTEENEDA
jgi:hypothetical protein